MNSSDLNDPKLNWPEHEWSERKPGDRRPYCSRCGERYSAELNRCRPCRARAKEKPVPMTPEELSNNAFGAIERIMEAWQQVDGRRGPNDRLYEVLREVAREFGFD